jgi:hypothetical protein
MDRRWTLFIHIFHGFNGNGPRSPGGPCRFLKSFVRTLFPVSIEITFFYEKGLDRMDRMDTRQKAL